MKSMKRLSCLLVACATSINLYAKDDLLDVYFKALKHDPTFQSAFSNKLATEEAYPQARALFLPMVAGKATHTHTVYYNDRYDTSSAQANFSLQGRYEYHKKYYAVSLVQSVFNYQNWAKLNQANSTVKQAVSTYNAALQNLIVRTTNAYLDVLQAEDTLRFTLAEKRANRRQLAQAQHRYKVGLDAITSVYDARASFDAVKARAIVAQNDVNNSKEKLREITGFYHKDIANLAHSLPLLKPDPLNANRWIKTAVNRNFSLMASRYASEASLYNRNAQFGGHLPTVDLTGEINATRGGTAGMGGSYVKNKVVGVQLEVPLFEGGLVNSQTRQAEHQYHQAKAELEKTKRQVLSETLQSYNSVLAGIATVQASKQAVRSAQSSVESTEAAFKVGTRTMVDVLDAQKDLYDTERALAKSQYDYLRAVINLKNAAGTLNVSDIEEVNTWLDVDTRHTSIERFKKNGILQSTPNRFSQVPTKKHHKIIPSKKRKK